MQKIDQAVSKATTRLIRWYVGTATVLAGLAFAAGKIFR